MSVAFRSLLDEDSGKRAGAREIAEALRFGQAAVPVHSERPYLMLNMAITAEGNTTIGGRAGPIGGPADRELFHELRAIADGLLVGAGTLRTERYNRIVDDASRRQRRRENGLQEEPFACVVSAALQFPEPIALLEDPTARVLMLTGSQASLPSGHGARVQYVRAGEDERVDLAAALRQLRERFDVGLLLCEGGPHLNRQLFAAEVVDELWLCLAPKLAGQSLAEPPLSIIAGGALEQIVELELLAALQSQSYLFLRYRVRGRSS